MRGTDKLNICETFYIYVGQWRTGRSRVCVTLQSSRNDKKSSIGSRSILVRFSIGSRSFFVRPSFCLRSSFVRQSKIYRRTIEDLSKKQRKHNGATREQLKSGNEHATSMKRTTIEWGAVRNVECWMLSVEWLPLAMLSFECWVLSFEWLPLAMLSFEFWILNCRLCRFWIVSFELWIKNSQLTIEQFKMRIAHNSKFKTHNSKFKKVAIVILQRLVLRLATVV